MKILSLDYYRDPDVLHLSQELLGKFLMTKVGADVTGGIIVETEAYRAPEDRASHAYGNKKTKRNAPMFESGGISYIYLCYGIHTMFNIVTNIAGQPHAILIRAVEPTKGVDLMLKRRKKEKLAHSLTAGPGALTQALGITLEYSGLPLTTPPIWIEDHGMYISENEVLKGPRVGINYAGEDALLPWRFRIKDNLWAT